MPGFLNAFLVQPHVQQTAMLLSLIPHQRSLLFQTIYIVLCGQLVTSVSFRLDDNLAHLILLSLSQDMTEDGLPLFCLLLTLTLHPSSGFLMYNNTSPPIVLRRFSGSQDNENTPVWVKSLGIDEPHTFWQPRAHMLEMAMIACSRDMADSDKTLFEDASDAFDWCKERTVRDLRDSYCLFIS